MNVLLKLTTVRYIFYTFYFVKLLLVVRQILRGTHGYNEQGMLLLPPRNAGEKLPEEIVHAYEPEPTSADPDMNTEPEEDSPTDRESAAASKSRDY